MSIRNEVFVNLAQQVAEHLPGEWTVEGFPSDWGRGGAYLHDSNNQATLIIGESQDYADRNKNKISISGDYPRDRDGRMSEARRFSIKVSGDKSAELIARDVERRLLPDYLPVLRSVLATLSSRDAYEDKTTRIAQSIADLVHVKRDPREATVSFYKSPYDLFTETMSGARVLDEDDVELTLRLDAETSLKVLNLLIHGSFQLP